MRIRTDQMEVLKPQVEQPKIEALPVSVRSLDVKQPKTVSQAEREILAELEYQPPETFSNMNLPKLKDIGRAVSKIGTVVPNPISRAVDVVNTVSKASKPQPPKAPGINLPPPPVNITPNTPKLVDPNPKPKLWDRYTTYVTNKGMNPIWVIVLSCVGVFIFFTPMGRKLKRKLGGR